MIRILILSLLGLFVSFSVQARTSTNVPAYFPNYDYLDRLEAFGCAYPTFRQFFPQTQYDLRSALAPDAEDQPCQAPSWLLKERQLLNRYPLQNDVRAEMVWLHNDLTPLLGTESAVTPLFDLRQNRTTFNGPNLYSEIHANAETQFGELGLGLSATPGWVGALDDYHALDGRFYLEEGYVKVGYHWTEVLLGRIGLRFGSTAHGSLLLSAAASPLDLVKFAVRPHLLGWIFDYLGPVAFETWVTQPVASQFVNGDRFWALQLGMRPFRWFELAFIEIFQFGGQGMPGLGFSDFLKMIPYGGGSDLTGKRERTFATHLSFWFPQHLARLYTQFSFGELRSLGGDLSYLLGLWFPRVGAADLRVEYIHTAPNAYQSATWQQGLTYQNSPLGSPLGPGGRGLYIDVGIPDWEEWRPTVGFVHEARGVDSSAALAVAPLPETRYGGTARLQKRWTAIEADVRLSYQLIQNPLYQQAPSVNAVAGYTSFRYSFF